MPFACNHKGERRSDIGALRPALFQPLFLPKGRPRTEALWMLDHVQHDVAYIRKRGEPR